MRRVIKKIISVLIILAVIAGFSGCMFSEDFIDGTTAVATTEYADLYDIDEEGSYNSKDDVALYLYIYGHLPSNYITKNQARALGWESGNLDPYQYGACIGGDRFGNREGYLPDAPGRDYFECDIDTIHRDNRGSKRIVYSDDGLIYYTEDHYNSFELLYGEP